MRSFYLSALAIVALCAQAPAAPAVPQAAFTPPTGWTEMPSALLGRSVTWTSVSPLSDVIVTRSPSLIPAAMMSRVFTTLVPTLVKSLTGSSAFSKFHTTSSLATLCGNPGNLILVTLPHRADVHTELIIETSHGTSYVIISTSVLSPAVDRYLRTLCPGPGADIAALSPPPGFTRRLTLQPIAEWQGPVLGDAIVEMSGPPQHDLTAVLQSIQVPTGGGMFGGASSFPRSGNVRNITQSCGSPAIEDDAVTHFNGMALQSTLVAVQSASSSDALEYTSMGAPDPAVLTAMHAFCPP